MVAGARKFSSFSLSAWQFALECVSRVGLNLQNVHACIHITVHFPIVRMVLKYYVWSDTLAFVDGPQVFLCGWVHLLPSDVSVKESFPELFNNARSSVRMRARSSVRMCVCVCLCACMCVHVWLCVLVNDCVCFVWVRFK